MLLHLPIDDFLKEIGILFQAHQNLVLTAAPGAGKTTRLPAYLSRQFPGKIIVLEPRRMAAIAAAHRVAEEQNWSLGQEVGYTVRFANESNDHTRLIYMTEALFARTLLQDPELSGIDAVILDEFHERSVHVDLCLGIIRELQEMGHPIRLVVMSATLQAEKISAFLDHCPIVSVPGKLYPLEIIHQKSSQVLNTGPDLYDSVQQTLKLAAQESEKDILVFLPGVGEIERTLDKITSWAAATGFDILPLHGSLDLKSQQLALRKGSRRRIILATNIAESSVTVDGVDTVIDTGIAKQMKQNFKTGFGKLELTRISLNSAIQRSGRAARQYPGRCYRLWSRNEENSFQPQDLPEVQRIDLSESLLFLAAQGLSNFESFSWFEKPPKASFSSSLLSLTSLEALDEQHRITDLGRKLLKFPLPLHLALLVLKSLHLRCVRMACDIAAILQEKDFIRKEDLLSWAGAQTECDLIPRLEEVGKARTKGNSRSITVQNILKSSDQIYSLAKPFILDSDKEEPQQLERLLIHAFTDRLCRRRGKSEKARMVGGRGVKLGTDSLVKNSEFFVALQGLDTSASETQIFLASGFSKDFILKELAPQIQRREQLIFDDEKEKFYAASTRCFRDLELDEPTLSTPSSETIQSQFPQLLLQRWEEVLKQNEDLGRWWLRLQFLLSKAANQISDEDQDLDLENLKLQSFEMACLGETSFKAVMAKDLAYFFQNGISSSLANTLNKHVPDHVVVPSGSRIKIHYPEGLPPYLEVRIQEVFGMQATPRVLFEQLPITFHLLGPNYRPVQVTSDLESFWKNGYPEVRKELRLKYPKHQWPEDPADGTPEAKGRRRN